jgi:hypothetical protein
VPRTGVIALQLHRGEPMEVQYTNIRVKPIEQDAAQPARQTPTQPAEQSTRP